ncbi:MAG: 16S rRNA (guanine(966)-N(2))-methyltransferase RsmD [bacterium]
MKFMRVIAGRFKRRTLREADPSATRPTTDKNREMIFNILGQFFDGGSALDLFAGTGALGIEALSRGVDSCTFVDIDPTAIRTIQSNLKDLEISTAAGIVVKQDALRFLGQSHDTVYDLIFLDPPYAAGLLTDVIGAIHSGRLLANAGIIVAESDRTFPFPVCIGGIVLIREVPAGHAKFAFYRWEESL